MRAYFGETCAVVGIVRRHQSHGVLAGLGRLDHRQVVTAMLARYYLHPEVHMAIRTTRSVGMILLGVWLILFGLQAFVPLPIPAAVSAVLALIAGVLIILGM